MKRLFCLTLLMVAVGCSSTSKKGTEDTGSDSADISLDGRIDLSGIRTALGLGRPLEQLGFSEKSFNTCEIGYGYPKGRDCKNEILTIIHFQLQCRDTEGTISYALTEKDIKPIAFKEIKWSTAGYNGTVETDRKGFARIQYAASTSQKRERLRLSFGEQFLLMRANEITKVITPKSWCDEL